MILQWDKEVPVDVEKLALLNNLVFEGRSDLPQKVIYKNKGDVGYGYYDDKQVAPKKNYQKACLLIKHLIQNQPSFVNKPVAINSMNDDNLRPTILKMLIPKTAVEYYILKKSITDVSQLAKIFNVDKKDMQERLRFLAEGGTV